MNSLKFEDTKSPYCNQLHFYTQIMNYLKEKLRGKIPFKTTAKKKKKKTTAKRIKLYLDITQKETKLYTENYKTLMKESEENTNKWNDILYSQMGKSNIVKIFILCKATCRFKAISIDISKAFLTEREQSFFFFFRKRTILKHACNH